jgi:hypothetical protein
MAEATRTFNNISDAPKVGALIKPHVAALPGSRGSSKWHCGSE